LKVILLFSNKVGDYWFPWETTQWEKQGWDLQNYAIFCGE
jgi:hypothetical protein